MLSHPGETESVIDTEQNNREPFVTEEDVSLAWNASRSFSTKKNRYSQDRVYMDSDASPVHITDIDLGYPLTTPKFLSQPSKPSQGETQVAIMPPPQMSAPYSRTNKVHFSWKNPNSGVFNGNQNLNSTREGHSTKRVSEDKSRLAETEDDLGLFLDAAFAREKHNPRKERIKEYIESITFNMIVGVFTVFALLANDIGSLVDNRMLDRVLDIIAIIAFFVFAAEMVLALYVEDHYKWSLFFWLDLFSTLSITLHIEFLLEDFFPDIVHKSAGIAEASRASRLVTRETTLIQLIQIFQLGRLYKHIARNQTLTEMNQRKDALQKAQTARAALESKWTVALHNNPKPAHLQSFGTLQRLKSVILDTFGKLPSLRVEQTLQHLDVSAHKADPITKEAEKTAAQYRKEKKSNSQDDIVEVIFKDVEEENLRELKLTKKLSDYTMKQIVVLVMALLLIMPLFDSNFYFDPSNSQEYQMKILQLLVDNPDVTDQAKDKAIDVFIKDHQENAHLVYFKLGSSVLFQDPHVDINLLKHSVAEIMIVMTQQRGEMVSIISLHAREKIEAILELVDTVFICCVLTWGAILLNRDAQRLVLKPLMKIINRVNQIVLNPASAREPQKLPVKSQGFTTTACVVEDAIVRMAELLAIGFGDTGSAVITQNFIISGDLTSSLIGKKKAAIFGVIDIHDFIETTEALQEETLLFVNTIADIVHTMTDKYAGIVSQNMGDAFLLVWKFPEDSVIEKEGGALEIVINQVTQNIADCALMAFMKIYARINRDPTLLGYRKDARLNTRMPDYKVNVGFGLHVGWAVEGAIGSVHKIDAYYLSSDVNMAGRLEAGTRHYDVPLLFSGDLYEMFSDKMQNEARLIDEVEVEGLDHPFKIYTIEMSTIGLGKAKDRRYLPRNEKKIRQKKKKEYINEIIETGYAYTLLHTDRDLKKLLKNRAEELEENYKAGFEAYMNGDWDCAKKKFEECLEIRYDGPANNLLNYIGSHDFVAPEGWERRRVILKK